jgi:hypothetical protein
MDSTTLHHRPPAAEPAPPAGPRSPSKPRRRLAAVVALAIAGAAGLIAGPVVLPRLLQGGERTICGADALQAAAVGGLAGFGRWLEGNAAAGYVGEVGWPANRDAEAWNALADTWYDAADAIGLPVTAWAAGRWPSGYDLGIYRSAGGSAVLNSSGPQAAVVQRHPSTRTTLRGVAMASGSFGSDAGAAYSSTRPGRYGFDYSYDTAGSYTFLAGHGIRLVRLAFTWERLQPVPLGSLRDEEVDRLRTALDRAAAAGLRVVLDLHSYGTFALGDPGAPGGVRRIVLGSADLPTAALADLWGRLARATKDRPALAGYGLMNEPTDLATKGQDGAQLWQRASQESVDAIRATGSDRTISVSGYAQSAPAQWGQLHRRAWIRDPLDRTVYEAHAYFDADNSGRYTANYADELRAAQAAKPPLCSALPRTVKHPLES